MPTNNKKQPGVNFAFCVFIAILFVWNMILTVHVAHFINRENYGQLNSDWLGHVYSSTGDNATRIYVLEKQLGVER